MVSYSYHFEIIGLQLLVCFSFSLGNAKYEADFGKCAAPMVQMLDNLPDDVKDLPMKFYFDNLFSNFNLFTHLKERGYDATGTVGENRLPKDIPLEGKKQMLKKDRGTYSFTQSKDNGILVVHWRDNNVVTGMSTVYGVEPVTKASRYSSAAKKKISVTRPALFTKYNKHMGGTDVMDQNINHYRCGIRCKKWWWPIFTYLIDASINNAWICMRQGGSSVSQLDFRRDVAQVYLMRAHNAPKGAGRPSRSISSRTDNR